MAGVNDRRASGLSASAAASGPSMTGRPSKASQSRSTKRRSRSLTMKTSRLRRSSSGQRGRTAGTCMTCCDAVDHDRAVRVLGQGDKAFHAQQLRTVRGAQEVEEEVEGAAADGFVCGQAERPDAGVVAVDVVRHDRGRAPGHRCGPAVRRLSAAATASALSQPCTSAILPSRSNKPAPRTSDAATSPARGVDHDGAGIESARAAGARPPARRWRGPSWRERCGRRPRPA